MRDINLFISYSHHKNDEIYFKEVLEYIGEQDGKKKCPGVKIWNDTHIKLGEEWDESIIANLQNADIVLLIISQYFLNSNYITKTELKVVLDRAKEGKCVIVPIYAGYCDLTDYKYLTCFQGISTPNLTLSQIGEEKRVLLTNLKKRINNEIVPNIKIEETCINPDLENNKEASQLKALQNCNNIFLSIPNTEIGRKRRISLLAIGESKQKYEDWPYKFVPGSEDAQEIASQPEEIQKEKLSALITGSIYSIHLFEDPSELRSGLTKFQYELSKQGEVNCQPFKTILWMLDKNVQDKLESDLSTMLLVVGTDYEDIFEKIGSLEIEKEKIIKDKLSYFTPERKIYLLYDYEKDHNSELRIELKAEIEKDDDFSFESSLPDDDRERELNKLGECEGALIYYGNADSKWFILRQADLLSASINKIKAICIDDPYMEDKKKRDLWKKKEINIVRNKEQEEFHKDMSDFKAKVRALNKSNL